MKSVNINGLEVKTKGLILICAQRFVLNVIVEDGILKVLLDLPKGAELKFTCEEMERIAIERGLLKEEKGK